VRADCRRRSMTTPMPARPMRIAQMLESDGPGGAETVLVRLSSELRARGHMVFPVGPDRGIGWLGARLREEGFAPDTFSIRRPLDWRCLRGMIRLLRERRVDVVHSHEFTMAIYGAAAARWLGIRHVITMHGSQYVMAKWRRREALRLAFRASAYVVGCSADTTTHLEHELGLHPGTFIRTVSNGVPFREGDRAASRVGLGVQGEELLLFAAGNLIERKGHAVLIRALASLRPPASAVRWRLAIAGQGVERERLLALAADCGVSDRVHLLGQRADIMDLQTAADVFVMPSLWEGLPLALLEAMHAGSAIVASRTSGIPEAITDGVEGVLTPPGDVRALSDAIASVLLSGELRARLGGAARDRAQSQFSMRRMTDEYEALYQSPTLRHRRSDSSAWPQRQGSEPFD
jgi:glycosyltransferase involved in cell wall biosynthesis